MARLPYELNEYATSTIKSSNGTTYTATLWWNDTGAGQTWTLGPSGAEINYESETVDDKNSPILTSNLSFPVMVEDVGQQSFINSIFFQLTLYPKETEILNLYLKIRGEPV